MGSAVKCKHPVMEIVEIVDSVTRPRKLEDEGWHITLHWLPELRESSLSRVLLAIHASRLRHLPSATSWAHIPRRLSPGRVHVLLLDDVFGSVCCELCGPEWPTCEERCYGSWYACHPELRLLVRYRFRDWTSSRTI